jgi:hypothetical protein
VNQNVSRDNIVWLRVAVVDVPEGNGLVYQTALAVESKNKNFLEGCYHLYTPHDQAFPGTVLSTGTEDCALASIAQPIVVLRMFCVVQSTSSFHTQAKLLGAGC